VLEYRLTNTLQLCVENSNTAERSLGGSSPLCAVTSITNDISYTSQTQQN